MNLLICSVLLAVKFVCSGPSHLADERQNNNSTIKPIFMIEIEEHSEFHDFGKDVLKSDEVLLQEIQNIPDSPFHVRDKIHELSRKVNDSSSPENDILSRFPLKRDHFQQTRSQNIVSLSDAPVMCGSRFVKEGSTIWICTPNYPLSYSGMSNCEWKFKTISSYSFIIDCESFSLHEGDQLLIAEEGKENYVARYEANSGPQKQTFVSSSMCVTFQAQFWNSARGFYCSVTSIASQSPSKSTPKPTNPPTIKTTTTTTTTKPTTLSQFPPLSDPECGVPNRTPTRIMDGQFADVHEYPWIIYLRIQYPGSSKTSVCGGSLISNDWVLTAAHCVLKKSSTGLITPKVELHFGVYKRLKPTLHEGFMKLATNIVIHPALDFFHDLALIRFDHLQFSHSVRPICLPNRYMHNTTVGNVVLAVIGWGRTQTGQLADELIELGRHGIDKEECRKHFGKYITDHHFCTSGNDQKHICLGDSGGSVMTVDRGRFFLRGIISFVASADCRGTRPDGHTSVTHFLDWIEEVTGIIVQ